MTDRKLTEAEMISYLELSVELGNTARLAPEEAQTLLALINRQKAEIESLQADIAGACVFLEERRKIREQEHKTQIELLDQIKEQIPLVLARAKSEAIKGFAERVKAHTRHLFSGVDVGHIVDELVIQETEERTE